MSNFELQHDGYEGSTSVPNSFIEKYLPTAAGEFVKIYIYLLKCVSEKQSELSVSRIADVFNNTEKDTIRALKYWQKHGLLKLTFSESGELTSLVLTNGSSESAESEPSDEVQDSDNVQTVQSAEPEQPQTAVINFTSARQYSRGELDTFARKDSTRMLIFVIQRLLGRVLTSADINALMFFEDTLQFPEDLIEYLFEYCAEKKKTGIRYIEKTGIAWADKGIKNVNAAKLINSIYSENCYPVMKAFGLTGRNPAAEECRFIDTWVLSYGFSLEVILEACNRTINTIHQPSFEYTDSILRNWKKSNIVTLEDIKKADKEFVQKCSTKQASESATISVAKSSGGKRKNSASESGLNNFKQRSYDYDELEAKLINK